MCLILDANIVHRVFPSPHDDFAPVYRALADGTARLVYGGKLTREYQETAFRHVLRRLDQQGAARQFPDSQVDAEAERLAQGGQCKSDDPHILALAVVSKTRLLCSEDQLLADDFTNPAILSNPRGKVYKRAEHAHLIQEHCT
jgi:hypothetical protein